MSSGVSAGSQSLVLVARSPRLAPVPKYVFMRIDTAAVVPVSEVLPTPRRGVVMELNSDIVELSVPEIRAQCRQCGGLIGEI